MAGRHVGIVEDQVVSVTAPDGELPAVQLHAWMRRRARPADLDPPRLIHAFVTHGLALISASTRRAKVVAFS